MSEMAVRADADQDPDTRPAAPSKRLRRRLAAALATVLATGSLAACGQEEETEALAPELDQIAQAGTDIPEVDLNWGMAPFPDESLPVVAMQQGFFEDVGITIGPTPTGAKLDCTGSLAPLLTDKVQVCSAALEALLAQLDNTQEVQSFVTIDTVVGLGIFIPPESDAQSVQDFIDEGDSFDEAIKKAMDQLRGKRVALATDPAARLLYNIAFSLGEISPDEFQRSDLDNPNIVNLALAGKTDFPAPSGGAEVVRLLQEGFRPLVTQEEIQQLSDDPRRFETAIHGSFITTDSYYADEYATVLRAASVVYRTLELARDDFSQVSEDLLPFINAYAGQSLSEAELEDELTNFAKLRTFDEIAEFYSGPETPANLNATIEAQIEALRRDDVLQQEHTPDEIQGSEQVYNDLIQLKAQADELFDEVGDGGENADIVEAAREQYDNFNYLDAVRFLRSIES